VQPRLEPQFEPPIRIDTDTLHVLLIWLKVSGRNLRGAKVIGQFVELKVSYAPIRYVVFLYCFHICVLKCCLHFICLESSYLLIVLLILRFWGKSLSLSIESTSLLTYHNAMNLFAFWLDGAQIRLAYSGPIVSTCARAQTDQLVTFFVAFWLLEFMDFHSEWACSWSSRSV
jgi:hypothetical protein